MSLCDEPNHLNQVVETINKGQSYSEDEMKCFQHGMASPFMPRELIQEIAEETKADLSRKEKEFTALCKAVGLPLGGVNEK